MAREDHQICLSLILKLGCAAELYAQIAVEKDGCADMRGKGYED